MKNKYFMDNMSNFRFFGSNVYGPRGAASQNRFFPVAFLLCPLGDLG